MPSQPSHHLRAQIWWRTRKTGAHYTPPGPHPSTSMCKSDLISDSHSYLPVRPVSVEITITHCAPWPGATYCQLLSHEPALARSTRCPTAAFSTCCCSCWGAGGRESGPGRDIGDPRPSESKRTGRQTTQGEGPYRGLALGGRGEEVVAEPWRESVERPPPAGRDWVSSVCGPTSL